MSEQFSFPGFGDLPAPMPATKAKDKAIAKASSALDAYSLFFSIFPSPNDAVEITRFASALLQAKGLTDKPLLPHRLHVTLHDLGNFAEVPLDLVDSALKAGSALASDGFEVAFDRALSYPSSGTFKGHRGKGIYDLLGRWPLKA
jgi:RNA 2',3'-cyclic 3'-phosphodiesterase